MADVELSTLGDVIKVAYEGQDNTNAFTDAEKAKLAGIEAEATKNASDDDLRDRSTHTGLQRASSIEDLPDLLANKVDAIPGKVLSDANFTQDEKDKLAGLEDAHFKGVHVGVSGLEAAHPAGEAGDYAVVDDGVDLTWYQWDAVEEEWVPRTGESTEITPAQVKTYYESNPDTNAFTDDEKAEVAKLVNRYTLRRRGTWNAATNTPALLNGEGTPGDYYIVTTPGTINFGTGDITFQLYDRVEYEGGTWHRLAVNPPPAYSPRGSVGPAIFACRYVANGSQSIAPNTDTFVDATAFANGAMFDPYGIYKGDGTVQIPAWASYARISASAAIGPIAETEKFMAAIIRNGSILAGATSSGLTGGKSPIVNLNTGVVPVSSGDPIAFRLWHNHAGGSRLTWANMTWVTIELFEAI